MNERLKVAIGLGCQRGVSLDGLERAIAQALHPLGEVEVSCIASHARKADEPALLELARTRGWPLRFYPADALAAVAVPTPSERLTGQVGTSSVAEAAARIAAGAGELLVEKQTYRDDDGKGVTVAVARVERRKPNGLEKYL